MENNTQNPGNTSNPIEGMLESTMVKIREMVDTNTVVGTPITTPDGVTLVPISKVSFGFGVGGMDSLASGEKKVGFAGGNGAGITISPVAFLVISDGNVRMINVAPPANTAVDRAIEMVPEIIDRVEGLVGKYSKKTPEKDG